MGSCLTPKRRTMLIFIINNKSCHWKQGDLVFHWCLYNQQNITYPLGYEFIFSCSTRYLTHSLRSLVHSSWPLEDKIHIHTRACNILYITQFCHSCTYTDHHWESLQVYLGEKKKCPYVKEHWALIHYVSAVLAIAHKGDLRQNTLVNLKSAFAQLITNPANLLATTGTHRNFIGQKFDTLRSRCQTEILCVCHRIDDISSQTMPEISQLL